jgi:hypothetical protein
MKIKLPHSTQNWISLIGATIAVIALFMIVFLFMITGILQQQGSYMGLIVYILLPAIMITGLGLIPIGMFLTTKKLRLAKEKKPDDWPKIDLNNLRHRNAFFIFSIGTTIFLFLSGIGSYEAFHFTESVEFCGEICHSVMEPEYVAYQHSSHARVACVACHVGTGVDWYMRSKLSGLYQVYAVVSNVYPRPIPTPIKNLRPARETCEQCHWPEKFYTENLHFQRHYMSDEENTQWNITLRMKIGAAHEALGLVEGIHWHINSNVKIEYIAEDEKNEKLPWVRYTNLQTGKETVYMDDDNPLDEEKIQTANIREMDCMDCHTRPSHSYKPPAFFVNEAITAGHIPHELPEIKSLSMDICSEEINTKDSAMSYIRETIEAFYQSDYPEIVESENELVEKAILGLQTVYFQNIFPEMKVRWSAYPNHIGHLEFDGCFRCHNDTHKSEDEKVISMDCNLCHSIDAQGPPDEMEYAMAGLGLDFKHPVDIDEEWRESLCTDCHTGLNP